ncbi:MAG: ATP-binding protein [Verrucomicrobiota bacterium]
MKAAEQSPGLSSVSHTPASALASWLKQITSLCASIPDQEIRRQVFDLLDRLPHGFAPSDFEMEGTQATHALLKREIAERTRAEKIQKALYQISEAIHTTEDLPSLYTKIHAIIAELMPANNFYIALLDASSGCVSFPYHVDEIDDRPVSRRGGRGVTEYVIRTGRALLANLKEIEELKEAGEYVQTGAPAKIWLGVPLTIQGRTFGVMAVQDHHNENVFGQEEKQILSFVAGQIALAIDRKRAEAELRESAARLRQSEERFSKAFHASPAGMAIMRLDNLCFVDANENFLQFTGFQLDDLVGRDPVQAGLLPSRERLDELKAELLKEGRFLEVEIEIRKKSGEPRTMFFSGELCEIGQVPCVIGVGLDVTERKKAESELLKSLARERELNRMKSQFVSMVSHEFRTPLGIIMSSAEILDRYFEQLNLSARQEHLHSIQHYTRRMSGFMEDMLLFGKVEAGKLEFQPAPLDLPVLCRRVADEVLAATDHRCPIELRLGKKLAPAFGDEGLLRHIFSNLLTNAVKYSAAGEPVLLEAARGVRGAREAVFTIEDHGIGIPAVDQDRLFNAFHRGENVAHLPGTGLGLVIVKRCVELHRGKIQIQSAVGQGTTVVVQLPLFTPARCAR